MKQVMAARADLGMTTGKLAAQVAHASLKAYEKADERARQAWMNEGGRKIVVKVDDEDELLALADRARASGLPYAVVRDAGHTELEPGTLTTLGIGPADEKDIDHLTGSSPLYK